MTALIMSDEAHFHLTVCVNEQNFRYWPPTNPRKSMRGHLILKVQLSGFTWEIHRYKFQKGQRMVPVNKALRYDVA